MPTIRTFARPVNDSVTVQIPREYRSYSFKVLLVPVAENAAGEFGETGHPAWAGLCEGDITRNFYGPHDMNSIRESIKSAERVEVV